MPTHQEVIDATASFIIECDELRERVRAKSFPNTTMEKLEMKIGPKRIKIVAGGSVWAFIELSNGDILKAETWNRPAKHARGNVFDANRINSVEWTGPKYLR